MGFLDDLLGGLAGQPTGGRAQQQPGTGGGGMNSVLLALMPVVLSMLSNRGPDSRGGLGDVLGHVLGGAAGGRGSAGGLGGLLEQLERAGFGAQADSWVARGVNEPIPPDAMTQIFGRDGLEEISRQAGISEAEASRGLSELLPEIVDHVTPDGDVPDSGALTNGVQDLARRFGLS